MRTQIRIVPYALPIETPKNVAFTLYLYQIEYEINPSTRRIRDKDAQWRRITEILRRATWSPDDSCILVLPESCLPSEHAAEFCKLVLKAAPEGTLVIAGLETMPLPELVALSARLGWVVPSEMISEHPVQIPANVALILAKGANDVVHCLVQPKLTHSKFEASLYEGESLFEASTLWYLQAPHYSFVVLICSDIFTRPQGSTLRLVDYIDYDLLKKGYPVDFLFNIQFNPSPEHPLFQESLARLYDDGYQMHGGLSAVLLNACIPGHSGSGRSKLLVHGLHRLTPLLEHVIPIAAPVRGIDFGSKAGMAVVRFDRLPKLWDERRDHCAMHTRFFDSEGNDQPGALSSIVGPGQDLAGHSPLAMEDFINQIANEGRVTRALGLAEQLRNQQVQNGATAKGAHAAYLGARIARNSLRPSDALRLFADAESLLRQLGRLTPSDSILLWRVQSAKAWLETYILEADVKRALQEVRSLIQSQEEWVQHNRAILSDVLYRKASVSILHDKRKEAELLLVLGRYTSSVRLSSRIYRAYGYSEAEAKAYAALIRADACRMLGEIPAASVHYMEVENYARDTGNKRLIGRALRNKAEMLRFKGDDPSSVLDELDLVSKDADYGLGRLYGTLIRGAFSLRTDPQRAHSYFQQAAALSVIADRRLELEYTHAMFGLAEVTRLLGKASEARELYKAVFKRYRWSGVLWGQVRTRIGLVLCGADEPLPQVGDGPIGQSLILRARSGEIQQLEPLMLNMP